MSSVALFAWGMFVTLLVAAALALLVWGAILDGRDERNRRHAAPVPLPRPDNPSSAGLDPAA